MVGSSVNHLLKVEEGWTTLIYPEHKNVAIILLAVTPECAWLTLGCILPG
jgi:hypothetical protein